MAQQPKEKKLDLSCLPRGAISIKGLPISRNTRLPSIRSPRDLTLGGQPKRTFMPNIPVRREKKPQPENVQVKQENVKVEKRNSPQLNDRGRGRGRGKPQIIQTQGSIFSEGIAADPSLKKERMRDSYPKSEYSASSRGVFIKKEKDEDVAHVSTKMEELLRDDFIDDGDDWGNDYQPTKFPLVQLKKEAKTEAKEPVANFDPNIAKEMDFDINRVAKYIKKEKGTEVEEKKSVVSCEIPSNEITDLFNGETSSSKLVLIQFPKVVNMEQKMEDSESSNKRPATTDSKSSDNQNINLSSINSLPEGYIGKLQILKSGKTRLLIGPVEFSLDSVNPLITKHQVVSIKTDSNTGDLTVLGPIQQKLQFAPRVDSLLA